MVYAVVFFSIAMAVNIIVVPQVGEAVAKGKLRRGSNVLADVAGVQNDEWFIQKENELKADVVRKYLHELIDTAVPDAGLGFGTECGERQERANGRRQSRKRVHHLVATGRCRGICGFRLSGLGSG